MLVPEIQPRLMGNTIYYTVTICSPHDLRARSAIGIGTLSFSLHEADLMLFKLLSCIKSMRVRTYWWTSSNPSITSTLLEGIHACEDLSVLCAACTSLEA